ncbi:TadE/TadG family type IV pilus assembly protein [Devosia lacusdianchii]|uniref:TadE/TadG family type IV pilus assembly protein n=1 Tax=Devosia lacusdianchii TaxID=2917991 RepID=UPI001F061FCF|nr:TadE/TadG family type IV pilus assembly protein [Devosia sp. JXJ CY 41]
MATRLGSLIRRVLWRRRGFGRDERGATIIEFGLLAVPFFSILGAILETSIIFLSTQALDSAVQDASRLVRTGQARSTILTADDFRQEVCGRLFGLFRDCDGLFVDVQQVSNFASVNVSPPVDPTCATACEWSRGDAYQPGQGSSIMVVQVYYKWPVMLNFGLGLADLPDSKRLFAAVTVFRNEPFT